MKKVFKYGTGEDIPNEATYLFSREEKIDGTIYVWHYFLVEDERW